MEIVQIETTLVEFVAIICRSLLYYDCIALQWNTENQYSFELGLAHAYNGCLLIRTPEMRRPLKWGDPCIKVNSKCPPKVCMLPSVNPSLKHSNLSKGSQIIEGVHCIVQIHPWNESTPLIRTLWLVPRQPDHRGAHHLVMAWGNGMGGLATVTHHNRFQLKRYTAYSLSFFCPVLFSHLPVYTLVLSHMAAS